MNEITVQATIENVPVVTAFLDEHLEAHDCSMKAQMQIDVAVDEIFSNIVFYAYHPEVGEATVGIEFDDSVPAAILTFSDSGVAYNPLEKDDPDTTLSAEDRQIGGLGIFIVKKTMDKVEYRREDGKNILTVVKNI